MKLSIKQLPCSPYEPIWQAMKSFTDTRDKDTQDELWLLEHDPVFTQGLAGKPEHLLNPHNIPVVHTDRGGQITYHGPGQLMAYTLFDIKRLKMGPRKFVCILEQAVIDYLASLNIAAERKENAPGVYVDNAKICSLGLRVRRGAMYHGIAFNIDMDLTPFTYINPCGFKKLAMTQVKDFVPEITLEKALVDFPLFIQQSFGYTPFAFKTRS